MQMVSTEAIENLKSLHRGELAAVETYQQALGAMDGGAAEKLRSIQEDHRETAKKLEQHVIDLGIVPDTSSKIWGAFAKLVEGTAKLLGRNAALNALKEGEEHGLAVCSTILRGDLPPEIKQFVLNSYMPQLQQHIQELDKLKEKK